mgnify:CR=1 FL=1
MSNENKDVVDSQRTVTSHTVSNLLNELSPILDNLNIVLLKWNLTEKDISFSVKNDKVTAFISCI